MDNATRTLAILNYTEYDRLPIVYFGYWKETLEKWAREGHVTIEETEGWDDNNSYDLAVSVRLGFDFNWFSVFDWNPRLVPPIEKQIIAEYPDGSRQILNDEGLYVIEKPGITSIPTEVDQLLKGRPEWEKIFKPRLHFDAQRLAGATVNVDGQHLPFGLGGHEALMNRSNERPMGLFCGSLIGIIRNWLGLVGLSYMTVDDPDLLEEMIETVGELCYQGTEAALQSGVRFDFAHFWEDICYKSGPLVHPRLIREKVGPHYQRITDLVRSYGIDIISVDCDGKIDTLVPIWLENGVNTMFPIEVGTWNGNLATWRNKYGPKIRGVGGMNKIVFAQDYASIDAEIERLRPMVEAGGFIPCPDHRIPPDARWENVQYYCDRLRTIFG